MKHHLLAVGPNPAWQKTLYFDHFRPGEVNRAAEMECFASGKGINFVRATTVWGVAEATLLQFAGGDTGKALTRALDRENMRHVTTSTVGESRCCMTCLCRKTGTMTELIEPTPIPCPEEIAAYERVIAEQAKRVHGMALCGQLPTGKDVSPYVRAAEIAAANHLPILVDSYLKIDQVLPACSGAILKINTEELAALSGEDDPVAGIEAVFKRFPVKICAITGGAHASYFSDGKNFYRVLPPFLPEIVNPLGSGDTTSAVFFSEYLAGTDPAEAFALAMAAASANCLSSLCGHFDRQTALALRKNVQIQLIKGSAS